MASVDLERVAREKEAHNTGLQRDRYDSVLKHAGYLSERRRLQIVGETLRACSGGDFLELGSGSWQRWLDETGVKPGSLTCINISEAEIESGRRYAAKAGLKPEFRVMDANALSFPDASFDVVFGSGILHHLEYRRALAEVDRVLRPGGTAVFHEPLDINPVGRVVRALTPKARTIDERPLRLGELRLMRRLFRSTFHYEQFLAVPLGVASGLLFKERDNPLTRSAFSLDRALLKVAPLAGPLYRHVLMIGVKAGRA